MNRLSLPHLFIQNSLVYIPTLAAHEFSFTTLLSATFAYLAFFLISFSSNYLRNIDPFLFKITGSIRIEYKFRFLFFGILISGVLVATILSQNSHLLIAVIVAIVLQLLYNYRLHQDFLLSICGLSAIYTMKVIGGGAATGLILTPWLSAFCVFLFLSISAIRYQLELNNMLADLDSNSADQLAANQDKLFSSIIAITSGYIAILAMALFVNERITWRLYESPLVLWLLCPILLYWFSRIIMLAFRGDLKMDLGKFVLFDKPSYWCGGLSIITILYSKFF